MKVRDSIRGLYKTSIFKYYSGERIYARWIKHILHYKCFVIKYIILQCVVIKYIYCSPSWQIIFGPHGGDWNNSLVRGLVRGSCWGIGIYATGIFRHIAWIFRHITWIFGPIARIFGPTAQIFGPTARIFGHNTGITAASSYNGFIGVNLLLLYLVRCEIFVLQNDTYYMNLGIWKTEIYYTVTQRY